jgi:hypothetical protein
MEISIDANSRLRASTNGKRIFADISSEPFQQSLSIEFYAFQKQIIFKKERVFKMFIFNQDQDITDFDYGYWNDAKIVWKSFID